MSKKEQLEPNKQAEINVRKNPEFLERELHKPFGYSSNYWLKWATITESFARLGIQPGAKVLDVGCGAGWTSAFLAETGFKVTGVDIVPQNIKIAKQRAKNRGFGSTFIVGDMDSLQINQKFDAVLIFDALHHTNRQSQVIDNISKHLKPGGHLLIGEPSLLHTLSPEARRVVREEGIIERGITLRSLRKDCRRAGMGEFRRFFEGTQPYEGKIRGFSWQLTRLVAANFIFAPSASFWFAAKKKV